MRYDVTRGDNDVCIFTGGVDGIPFLVLPDGLVEDCALADQCVACHNGLVAPDGRDLSIGADWGASMMAHSARDPYWQQDPNLNLRHMLLVREADLTHDFALTKDPFG